MTKRRLIPYLVFGVLAGLFVSACAGVTSGQIALPEAGDVLTVGPAWDAQLAPSFEVARPGHSAQFVFEKAVMEEETLQPAGLQSWTAAQSVLESQTQMQVHTFCSRAGH